jgi:hypothetical protein
MPMGGRLAVRVRHSFVPAQTKNCVFLAQTTGGDTCREPRAVMQIREQEPGTVYTSC